MKKRKFNIKKFMKSSKEDAKKHSQGNARVENSFDDLNVADNAGADENVKEASENQKNGKKIFDKIGGFFDPEPQKEKVLSKEDFQGAGDVYYASVSAFYKVFERIMWVLLVLFLAFSILTNYKEITFNNS